MVSEVGSASETENSKTLLQTSLEEAFFQDTACEWKNKLVSYLCKRG